MKNTEIEKPLVCSRFQILRVLKEGPVVNTYLGVDQIDASQKVIIKESFKDPISQKRLESEAQILKKMDSQWVPEFLGYETRSSRSYLVTRRVQGMPLNEVLKKRGNLPLKEAFSLMRCLLFALAEIHELGFLHQDIKPENIIVSDPDLIEKAVLIDFGFSKSLDLEKGLKELPVGTVRYMAPESAGLVGDEIRERADLYSAGLVLFECLSGVPLFPQKTAGEVLKNHLLVEVPKVPGVPHAVNDVIQHLLSKDPRDRYQHADAVNADIREICGAMEDGVQDPRIVVGLYDRRTSLTTPAFVGRKEEVRLLQKQLDQTKLGRGGIVMVEAESGGGKSRLLEEVKSLAKQREIQVIEGKGLDQGALFPLQPLRGVIQSFLFHARKDPGLVDRMHQHLGDHLDALCAITPELSPIFKVGLQKSLGEEEHAELRGLSALSVFLDAFGLESNGLVVLLDDCQWIDEFTLKFLEHWQSRRYEEVEFRKRRYTLVVVGFRSEQVSNESLLRKVKSRAHLKLSPFGANDLRSLVESMAGKLPEKAVETVIALAEGSPFFGAAVLQGLVETGALIQDQAGWKIQEEALEKVQSSRQAANILAKRLDLLSKETLSLLSIGAVIGPQFDIKLAQSLSKISDTDTPRAIREARSKQLIWFNGNENEGVFVHDKIREALLVRIGEAERKGLHRQIADEISRVHPDYSFLLSYHYGQAEEFELAFEFALEAGKKARFQNALEIAEHHFKVARKGLAGKSSEIQHQVMETLGEIQMLRGHYEEALESFDEARKFASSGFAQASLENKMGELAFKRGDFASAERNLTQALARLGHPAPRSNFLFFAQVTLELIAQIGHTLFPKLLVGTRSLEGAESSLLRVRAYSRLTYVFFFQKGVLPTLWSHLKELNLAEKYPPTKELGQAFSVHAPVMTMVPVFQRAAQYGKKGIEVRRAIGDVWGEAQALHFYGAPLLAAVQLEEAKRVFTEALHLLEKTGDLWESNGCTYHLALCCYRMGDLKKAVELSQKAHESGLRIGDAFASGASLRVWSLASQGKVPKDALELELNRQSLDKQRNAEVLQAEGVRLYYEAEFEQAIEVLTSADQLVREAGLRTEYVSSIPIWLGSAFRCQAESVSLWNQSKRGELLALARKHLRRGHFIAHFYRNNLAHVFREQAILSALLNQEKKAKKEIHRSIEVARSQGAHYELAQSLYIEGLLGQEYQWEGFQESIDEAKEMPYRLIDRPKSLKSSSEVLTNSPRVTASLLDRFDSVISAGRRITAALSEQSIYEALISAAQTLLRGQHCVVIDLHGKEFSDHHSHDASRSGFSGASPSLEFQVIGDPRIQISKNLVIESIAQKKPIIMGHEFSADASISALLSGARSVICAPIAVRGTMTRCVYVIHNEVGELFGDDEEKLLGFITALGGVALENAEGFREINTLTQSLKEDVEQQAKAEKQIQASLREKEVLLGEVYHRTKNNMQVISSLINLQSQKVEDPKLKQVFRESQDRIRSMALIHEMLYQSKDLVHIQFHDYVRVLMDSLQSSYGGREILLNLDLHPVSIGIDAAIPCGLIVNELVSNAFKYAFPESVRSAKGHAPQIDVVLRNQNGEVQVTVRDNGIGVADDFRLENSPSLGLKLVKGLLENQLRGRIEISNQGGAQFTIWFQKKVETTVHAETKRAEL